MSSATKPIDPKAAEKRNKSFIRGMIGVLVKHKASPAPDDDPNHYTIDTIAGEMDVRVSKDQILCKFLNPATARKIRYLQLTGKGNWVHTYSSTADVDLCVQDFDQRLRSVL